MTNSNINAHCRICGQGYHRCNSCEHLETFNSWRAVADTQNCYKIYTTLYLLTLGKISETEAYNDLSECDLSNLEGFVPSVRTRINDILNSTEIVNNLNNSNDTDVLKEVSYIEYDKDNNINTRYKHKKK